MSHKSSNHRWAIPAIVIFVVGLYYVPPVHSRLSWRLDSVRTQIKYMINPPDEAVFQPEQQNQLDIAVTAMMQTLQATMMPQTGTTALVASTPRPGSTLPPPVISTPVPTTVQLSAVKYEHQHGRLNYCGPANFSMALTYWGWNGNRDVVGKAVKPSDKDKNVMPYELQDFITDNVPGMTSVIRYGGDIELLKRMVAAGFPVVVEKGIYEVDINGHMGWMGHYAFVTGYDDTTQEIIYQDTYQPEPKSNPGPNRHIKYSTFLEGWRAFDYIFVVVYPLEKETQVMALLGPLANENDAARHALSIAQAEAQTLTDIDQYFAWFNVGTSHVMLLEYADAAIAYDYAFNLYANLNVEDSVRPYRMMWYQTGPYKAYYYTNRFSDVINLADTTLNKTISEPVLEESLYWRGRAYYMAGQTDLAVKDYRDALKVHPNWIPAVEALQDLGLQP
ncbi:MAG TPA: C39 family peptidase [Anaerolineales bacterium]|nr:C39 family peptidase [Anaerolineales bacterium]